MADYVASALFVYFKAGKDYLEKLIENPHGVSISPVLSVY
jgi:hypothetical protein